MNNTTDPGDCTEMSPKPGRGEREAMLVAALAGGCSVSEASRRSGFNRRTISRRLADPSFRREVLEARSRMIESSLGKLTGSLSEAADALAELLKADSAAIRLAAARSVFELAVKLRDSTEFGARLSILEEAQRVQSQRQA